MTAPQHPSIQMLVSPSEKKVIYNPARDYGHNFPSIAMVAAKRLEDITNHDTVLRRMLQQEKITPEQLGDICVAALRFVHDANTNPMDQYPKALERSGWFQTSESAQFLYLAILGSVIMGGYYVSVKEIKLGKVELCESPDKLVAEAKKISDFLLMPSWKRKIIRTWNRIKASFSLLVSGKQ